MARRLADSNTDEPGPGPEMRGREAAGDLPARLSGLPRSHPSSADYASADHASADHASADHASADYADPAEIRLPDDRRTHTLDGDQTGGGHRHGTGRPGETEFPAEWTDDRIVGAVLAVARNPDRAPERQNWNGRWQVTGKRDGVQIFAIVQPDGRIWTAWPDEGSPGVTKNPVKDT